MLRTFVECGLRVSSSYQSQPLRRSSLYYLSTYSSSNRDENKTNHQPITKLTEDELAIRQVTKAWVEDHLPSKVVRVMDEQEKMDTTIIRSLFQQGFMGMVRFFVQHTVRGFIPYVSLFYNDSYFRSLMILWILP